MNQAPAAAQISVREEERILGISYDRAVQMIPKLIREASGGNPQELGDGYYLTELQGERGQKREITVRLGRQSADTRISIRVESFSRPPYVALIIIIGILTFGLGILPLIPWMQAIARKEARERELLVHKTFRSIEEAVAQQGVSTNYRVAPGADANIQQREREAALTEAAGAEAAEAAEVEAATAQK